MPERKESLCAMWKEEGERNFNLQSFTFHAHFSLKSTVTVAMTGTGFPLRNVGLYFHCFTAARAASFKTGLPS